MSSQFEVQSSDPALLQRAIRQAGQFVEQYRIPDLVGVAYLGAVVRGYFDPSADIDVAVFNKRESKVPC